ncbi:mps one binder kinase activator-like 1 like B [Saprolegnia diclina VS20]|uniref:Mps one binder kinase activator-like 1 like B n=1 Tax=Saprolegnia diclina (strain VS20) TaxID=1156394 RepID=T0QYM4_SAPDV|nr:mps one binder kinase activator-like 1 like B [Saprolegnia diclina VS20]EQC39796.1 mps one binder kinase activator-like 1 like B [Saprolegnia diclina VS20]|eukprot:XP_008607068.1 mps one binder kinase activator-like 1 like B [Saprolegnia diclina VS20]
MNIFQRHKTFRPKKSHSKGTKRYDLHKHAKATLGGGDMRSAVRLPEHEDLNEWLAVNTVDFFNEISIVYGTILEFCSKASCPIMSAGPKFEYLWKDTKNYKTPAKLPAPEYIDMLMSWVEDQLGDPTVFPATEGAAYPRNFQAAIKNIFRRLFRVYAHVYYSHFDKIVSLGAEAHLNSCFKHFILFVIEFDLVDAREQEPLKDLIANLVR